MFGIKYLITTYSCTFIQTSSKKCTKLYFNVNEVKDKKKRVERFYKQRALKNFIILHSFIKLPPNSFFLFLKEVYN